MNELNLAYKTKKEIVNARLVAFGIDYLILTLIFTAMSRFIYKLNDQGYYIFVTLISVIYFISFESILGCTVGKSIMGLKIIGKGCNKPELRKVLVRSILRFITFIHPIIIVVWVVEYIIAYKSIFKQRLSDRISCTYVVYRKELNEFRENNTENSMSLEEFISYNNIPKIKRNEDLYRNYIFDTNKVFIEFESTKLRVLGIEGLSIYNVILEMNSGARFVVFYECFSAFLYTKRTPSNIYFIRNGEKNFKYHKLHTLLTLIFGWWGIPWGLIWTINCIKTNFSGGIDVTQLVFEALNSEKEYDSCGSNRITLNGEISVSYKDNIH